MELIIRSARGVDVMVNALNTDSAVMQDLTSIVQQEYLLSARDVAGLLNSCKKPTANKNTGHV
jgi:hypothetical protein